MIVLGSSRAEADYTFGTPTNLGLTVNSSTDDFMPNISADGLTIFFVSARPGGYGGRDIWVMRRDTIYNEWGTPMNLESPINSKYRDSGPSISADGLSLFFDSDRSGGYGTQDIWVSTRPTQSDPWGEPVNLGATVNSSSPERAPSISADGLELFFHSDRPISGMQDLWVTTRKTINDPWGPPVNLGLTVNSGTFDGASNISFDGLSLFFMSACAGGYGDLDIWVTKRASKNDSWGEAANLGPKVNSAQNDWGPSISSDGSILYFGSNRPGGAGGLDLWQVSIDPVVDFNADGIVDKEDACIMVDHWGEDYSLCDIGPVPWGDGVVDVQDLIVLAEHLLPVFLAHWELNETEGSIACDSVGDHDGTLNGNPLWQPTGGKVNGTLQLDGIDDYLSADFAWNIWKMKISATAWINGGEPGQVIISQADGTGYGASWLYTDSSSGKLTTKLMDPQPSLVSESVITDGTWHHIGLVWDGSYRYLYVDGAEVAKDAAALSYTVPCDGSLYLGVGKTLDAETFFSGLIDDVRIYNKALTADEIAALAN
jgi:hypothetical protein